MMADDQPILSLRNVTKMFGSYAAVDRLSLDIVRGEVFSLLGPSGCGKSTTLRIIAGLEQPDIGEIELNGTVLVSCSRGTYVPSQKRNMGMVFQSYAIWPHLSVFDTIAYPLAIRKVPKAEIAERVASTIRLVGLEGYEDRLAPTLSGGQQQRVALARALIYEPDVLLLDEPFSNLDVKLREQMRLELKLLQRRVGVTVILVTHDQIEALSLSDRIAVMDAGHIEQLGAPHELYENPRTPFVRDFIGTCLSLSGKLVSNTAGAAVAELESGERLHGHVRDATLRSGDDVLVSVRPESLVTRPMEERAEPNTVQAVIKALLFVGDKYECILEIGKSQLRSFLPRAKGEAAFREGQRIALMLPAEEVTIWPR